MFIQTMVFPGQLPTLHFHDGPPVTQIQASEPYHWRVQVAVADETKRSDRRQNELNGAVNGTSRKLEILLVESDPEAAKVIGEAVDSTGLDQYLTIARNPDAGMRYLYREPPFEQARRPDIVLLNLRLPRTDGLAVLDAVKRIRTSSRRPIAIIVLATFDDERTRRATLALGADAYFVKPVGAEDSAALSKKIRDLWECLMSNAHPAPETYSSLVSCL
jgi:CheY-like chemotaxis protein